MSRETVDVGAEVAALDFYCGLALSRGDDWAAVLNGIKQHPATVAASRMEDAR